MGILAKPRPAIHYPDSDGQPMADNTLQYQWIVTIQGNLDVQYRHHPDVFVAGDLLWYPVEGHPEIRAAPDVLVAFGRPKGYRGSYMQWVEAGIAPQVVWEILSPGNRPKEMIRKFRFYEQHGVEEYYLYDPDHNTLDGWRRDGAALLEIPEMNGFTSPRLGIRFDMSGPELRIYGSDSRLFLSFVELAAQGEAERQRAEAERQRTEAERQRTEVERQRAESERQRAERLAAKLRELGVDPEA